MIAVMSPLTKKKFLRPEFGFLILKKYQENQHNVTEAHQIKIPNELNIPT